jgi:heat shock protein HtpX
MVLSLSRARKADASDFPELLHLVGQLANMAALPMPDVHIVENAAPNAFAIGRNPRHATICVTTGLLERVSRDALAGVLAHELGHVKHRDTLPLSLVAMIAMAGERLAKFAFAAGDSAPRVRNALAFALVPLILLLAPFISLLELVSGSRRREFEADRCGAELSGQPLWLAAALERIEKTSGNAAHSATAERIARLKTMAQAMGHAACGPCT